MRNNGKASEAAVQEALKAIDNPKFDWQRLYDATSARNTFMSQIGDFLWFLPDKHGVIEVKSTQHTHRLSKSAFREGPRAKLYKRQRAGGIIYIFVHHHIAGYWRIIPFSAIYQAFNIEGLSSLDLSNYPKYGSATEGLMQMFQREL